jgi:hypothetical protein
MVCTLQAQVKLINITNLHVKSFKLKVFTGDNFIKYFKTIDASQVCTYLDFDGLRLKTPFMKRITSGWHPTEKPSKINPTEDRAPLAVLMAL